MPVSLPGLGHTSKTIAFSLKSEAKKAYLHANERIIML